MIKEYISYLKDNPKGYWFKRKLYGWGWTPVTWQGWMTVLLYVLAIFSFSLTVDDNSPLKEVALTFLLPVTLLTLAFVGICYRKGESPKWQWGISTELDQ